MRVFTADLFMQEDEIRDEEKAHSEKFGGEPCVVLPPYLKSHNDKIAYLCDRHACPNCHPETCSHTTDIRHAKNFVLLGDDRYMEEKK